MQPVLIEWKIKLHLNLLGKTADATCSWLAATEYNHQKSTFRFPGLGRNDIKCDVSKEVSISWPCFMWNLLWGIKWGETTIKIICSLSFLLRGETSRGGGGKVHDHYWMVRTSSRRQVWPTSFKKVHASVNAVDPRLTLGLWLKQYWFVRWEGLVLWLMV